MQPPAFLGIFTAPKGKRKITGTVHILEFSVDVTRILSSGNSPRRS
jgi:hypothetical protein